MRSDKRTAQSTDSLVHRHIVKRRKVNSQLGQRDRHIGCCFLRETHRLDDVAEGRSHALQVVARTVYLFREVAKLLRYISTDVLEHGVELSLHLLDIRCGFYCRATDAE